MPSSWLTIASTYEVILTPNRRLSRYLIKKIEEELQPIKNAWPTPKIIPYQTWLEWLCAKNLNQLTLLGEQEENILWSSISKQDHATVKLIKQAWETVQQWEVPLKKLLDFSDEAKTFYQWAEEFITTCKTKNLVDKNSLPELIMLGVTQKKIKLPSNLCFIGFDNVYPQLEKLLNFFSQHIELRFENINDLTADEKCLIFNDTKTERLTMAHWARKILNNKPNAHIGCVVPNLINSRFEIEQTFIEVFKLNPHPTPFNISAGFFLHQFPIICTTLKILELVNVFALTNICYLLKSPFIFGFAEEKNNRDHLVSQLNLLDLENIAFNLIESYGDCSIFAQMLKKIPPKPLTLESPSFWTHFFCKVLECFGINTSPPLIQEEKMLLQDFYKILRNFSNFDLFINKISYEQALSYLKNILCNTLYQKPNKDQPINILGILEAAGINFDYLWIMGMDNYSWPPTPSLNPFLPLQIQKNLGLPHATNERELEFTKKLLQRFKKSAKSIIYSCATYVDDCERKLSPLFDDIPRIQISDLELPKNDSKIIKKTKIFIEDSFLPVLPSEKISGGTRIFTLQALCPFKAFAAIRLRADLKPIWRHVIRGNIVHAVLEEIWKKINSYKELLDYSNLELKELINSSIDNVIASYCANITDIKYFFIENEKKCLNNIIFKWLQLEKKRSPFVIVALEQKKTINFAGIICNFRLDRIDQLQDGSLIIIDYKTGTQSVAISNFFGENLFNPQLPLYCLTSSEKIDAIIFAQIHAKKVVFKGISSKDIGLNGIKIKNNEEWQELLNQWQTSLMKLGQDFNAGKNEVNPGTNACRNCALKILCRYKIF